MKRTGQDIIAKRGARPNRYRGPRPDRRRRSLRKDVPGSIWRTCKVVFGGFFALTMIGVLSVGLVLGYHYLLNSPYFMVRKVSLKGLNRVTREEVLNRTGLDKPVNIMALRLGNLAENIEAVPWVESVVLTRKLPDTINIEIRERQPVALVSLGSLYYLDETGRHFKKVGPREKPELPIITGFTRTDLVDRRRFALRDLKSVFGLLEVLADRNDRFRLDNVSEINFDPVRGLSLFTRDSNVQIKIGFGEYRAKLRRLGRVLAYLKINGRSKGLIYFNLECSPRVIVRRAASS